MILLIEFNCSALILQIHVIFIQENILNDLIHYLNL